MGQAAELRFTPPLRLIDPSKPIRVSITMGLSVLSLVYKGDLATAPPPREEKRYVENLAALELARQIHAGVFGKDISIDDLRRQLRLAHYVSGHKFGDAVPDPNPSWTGYTLAFDYIVPADDENPEVLSVVVKQGKQDKSVIHVTGISQEHYRADLNNQIKRMGGTLGETSADGYSLTFWP